MKLIVEMEMPSCCARCPLPERTTAFDQKDDKEVVGYMCDLERSFFMKEDDAAKRRAYGCPIVGVLPETHGRLIDEAVFCENVVKYSHQSLKTIGKALDETPTIIDMTLIAAERKDDEQIH